MKCLSLTFDSNVLRLYTKDEMQGLRMRARCTQGTKAPQAEGSVLTYVT